MACTRSNYRRGEQPTDLRWPARYVMNRHDEELILDTIKSSLEDPQPIEFYKENGFGDFEADRLAIKLGDHPMMIWPGWIEAYE